MDAIKQIKQTEWFKKIKFFIFLNTGLALTAVGIAVFKTPNHFAFGGTSGISILLAAAFPGEGFAFSLAKFMGIFAITQIPLAISEGLLTVLVYNVLAKYSRKELDALGAL